eukprot:TRINITY_DN5633_c0_g2_i1.p3 TRINITY_DN5633_c0_g2~~TRINITY_DN5633_c0_g2_i1.p3  ORF type:complete len:388 (+),score=36.28 TRINITY_DN5633_c0_g2_i1:3328-4491(+)
MITPLRIIKRNDMTQLTFYPLGNADTTLAQLQDGRRMLFDYAKVGSDEDADKRCDLPKLLREDLNQAEVSEYSVVAFTHLDKDHCGGASEFFWFDHAAKYQGGDRIKMQTLWVPAAAIVEDCLDDCARVIRQEARHRLREGKGIKVFSRPARLRDWLKENGLTVEERKDCFVDAGQLVPEFSLADDAVEFFVHSPHAMRTDQNQLIDRNGDSIMVQMRFEENGYHTDVLITGDMPYESLNEIVDITRARGNDDRLHWNIYHLPHHCSYKSLGPDKGADKTKPSDQVAWLCEEAAEASGFVISASKPIPYKGSPEDVDVQPPHRQAASYYKEDVLDDARRFLVTMAEPSSTNPKPIILLITGDGAVKNVGGGVGATAAAAVVAPRAGF